MNNDNKCVCDLCGLPVEVQGFALQTKEGDKAFCCEGCKGIYQMLHEGDVIADTEEVDSKN
jgi:cation transport ATPase-like protein